MFVPNVTDVTSKLFLLPEADLKTCMENPYIQEWTRAYVEKVLGTLQGPQRKSQ